MFLSSFIESIILKWLHYCIKIKLVNPTEVTTSANTSSFSCERSSKISTERFVKSQVTKMIYNTYSMNEFQAHIDCSFSPCSPLEDLHSVKTNRILTTHTKFTPEEILNKLCKQFFLSVVHLIPLLFTISCVTKILQNITILPVCDGKSLGKKNKKGAIHIS